MGKLINADGRDVTEQTLADIKKVMGSGRGIEKAETVTVANGLVAYDLEAPSKNLYPVLTPLRNRIPRQTKSDGGDSANWKEVSAITGSGVVSMGWVPEGQRAGRMSITSTPKAATYVTLGEEADVSFEAQHAGVGFEDALAMSGMRLLHSMMIKEEYAILGGNRSVLLGTPVTPTAAVNASGGTIDAGANNRIHVQVVALTLEGYVAATLAGGIKRSTTVTGLDGKTFALYGGSSKLSAYSETAISGATNSVNAYTTPIKGAVAYAWFVELGSAGSVVAANAHLEAITTINSVNLTALNGTYQALSEANFNSSTDYSRNSTLAFDGLLYSAWNSSLAYYSALATGTPGTGTGLTASGRGSVVEIDNMLASFWNNYRLSPEEIYVNAQELKNISTKAMTTSGGASLVSIIQPRYDESGAPIMIAGNTVGFYFNPYSMMGGQIIPIKLHPNLPPGTIFAWAQNLPGYYQAANVPETAGVQCRNDYYQVPWALTTRANETGVYAEEVLKVYAPFALGTICNIADA